MWDSEAVVTSVDLRIPIGVTIFRSDPPRADTIVWSSEWHPQVLPNRRMRPPHLLESKALEAQPRARYRTVLSSVAGALVPLGPAHK